MRRFMYISLLVIGVVFSAVLLPTATVSAQTDCTLPNHIFWLPKLGNNANDGLTRDTPVLTMDRATQVASTGGGCIYLVSGAEDIFVMQVRSKISSTGIPLAPALVYGLMLLAAVALIAGGMWMRRHSMSLHMQSTM